MAALDELREGLERLRARKKTLEELLAGSGWAEVDEAFLGIKRAHGLAEMKTATASMDDAFRSAGVKGMVKGLDMGRALPHNLLFDIQHEMDVMITELEEMERDD